MNRRTLRTKTTKSLGGIPWSKSYIREAILVECKSLDKIWSSFIKCLDGAFKSANFIALIIRFLRFYQSLHNIQMSIDPRQLSHKTHASWIGWSRVILKCFHYIVSVLYISYPKIYPVFYRVHLHDVSKLSDYLK